MVNYERKCYFLIKYRRMCFWVLARKRGLVYRRFFVVFGASGVKEGDSGIFANKEFSAVSCLAAARYPKAARQGRVGSWRFMPNLDQNRSRRE